MILRTAPEGIGTQRQILLEASSILTGKTLEPSALEEALDGGPWRLCVSGQIKAPSWASACLSVP